MASLKLRASTYYIQFYSGGKQRRVNTNTDCLQIAKEKLRQFESAQHRGDDQFLPTRTPKARAAGIHLVFAAQRPDANVMPMQLRANLGNRLILRVDSEGTSEIALGQSGAENLLGRGHLLAKIDGEPGVTYAQVPFASPQFTAAVVAAARAVPG